MEIENHGLTTKKAAKVLFEAMEKTANAYKIAFDGFMSRQRRNNENHRKYTERADS